MSGQSAVAKVEAAAASARVEQEKQFENERAVITAEFQRKLEAGRIL